ncbi:MAG: HEAT repeat domain-containing protein [Gammaproteobacteria bacterium]
MIAEQTPLAEILQAVALKTGIEIKGFERLRAKVSVRFSQTPLSEGLRTLFRKVGTVSHVVMWAPSRERNARIVKVIISDQRSAASEEAREIQDRAVLDRSLTSHLDASMRRWAVEQFAEQADEESFAVLLGSLEDQDANVRLAALNGIAQRGDTAVEPIKAMLGRETDLAVLETAAQFLGQFGGEEAADLLGQMLNDRNIQVRTAAVEALGYSESANATEALTQAAQDPEPGVRIRAISTLAYYVQNEEARAVVKQALSDGDETVRDEARSLMEVFENARSATERR